MKTYREIGIKAGLEGGRLKLFIDYMDKRWKDEEETQCLTGYAMEWAGRFKDNLEWECSDSQGQMVLKELMGK